MMGGGGGGGGGSGNWCGGFGHGGGSRGGWFQALMAEGILGVLKWTSRVFWVQLGMGKIVFSYFS